MWIFLISLHYFRLLVSASQDGKLIIWDGYTTNKVIVDNIVLFKLRMLIIIADLNALIYADKDHFHGLNQVKHAL